MERWARFIVKQPKERKGEGAWNGPNFINKNYIRRDIHKYSGYLFRVMCGNKAFWLRGHTLGFECQLSLLLTV